MTGILWCTSPTRSLASVVRIVQKRISPSSSPFQLSQSPAKAKSRSSQEFFRRRGETQKERRCKKKTKTRQCLQSIRSNEERRRIKECR
jgi:hypothetical protein